MVSSTYVYGLSESCERLLTSTEACKNDMDEAIYDIRDYWVGMGQADFEADCRLWMRKTDQLYRAILNLQSGLSRYADQLQREEERARREEEERIRREQAAAEMARPGWSAPYSYL
ncbi:hypothetical protein [Paenibacillus turpanensis]|uniref:hypothetical protein n=1 Tax=Paenibacillus turpanensis TaxID=2689078 RepID=UPI00140DE6EE|nr:hypothetical protein [Paenibacillus turpanensis]